MNQQQVSKIKPQFCFYKRIDGSRSFREFFSKKYKHLSKLKVIKSSNEQNHRRIPILHKLSASVKSLDLSQYGLLEKYTRSHIKLVAKKFLKITKFSSFHNKEGSKSFLLTKIMLKKAKNLKYLCLKAIFDDSSCDHLLHLISRIKLKAIDLISIFSPRFDPAKLLDCLNCLPSSIEELCLYCKFQTETNRNFSIKHLENLQKLELGMLLNINTFMSLIKSIQDPSKLKTLRFQLINFDEFGASDIQKFLESCLNLEELKIQTELDVYPMSLMKLKKLTLGSTEHGLLRIIPFIQQQRESLESLSLTLIFYNANLKDELFEGLKLLKKLKKLKLNIKVENSFVNALDLTELIEALEYLEEVDLMGLLIDFKDDNSFEKFCKALKKRSESLTSIKLPFNGFKMNKRASSLFVQTLSLLPELKHITFKDFGVEDAGFYNELREIVCFKNANLNEVILDKVKGEKITTCWESLIEMLKAIISKPKMKQFCYLEVPHHGSASDLKDLKILNFHYDVREEVSHFDYLHLVSYACNPSFYYWDLDFHKWAA